MKKGGVLFVSIFMIALLIKLIPLLKYCPLRTFSSVNAIASLAVDISPTYLFHKITTSDLIKIAKGQDVAIPDLLLITAGCSTTELNPLVMEVTGLEPVTHRMT
ncbi:hypothetical protein ANA_P10002 (plasmid) [Anabaena sp. 90]|nr:hypothetical protein ANA_P10002 [Anabaena sp. 90]